MYVCARARARACVCVIRLSLHWYFWYWKYLTFWLKRILAPFSVSSYLQHHIISTVQWIPVRWGNNTRTATYAPITATNINVSKHIEAETNVCKFADDIFKSIFLNEDISISIEISLKFVARGPINNIPDLVQIMAWRQTGNKRLSEPIMISLPTHICVTQPQWVNIYICIYIYACIIPKCDYNSSQMNTSVESYIRWKYRTVRRCIDSKLG